MRDDEETEADDEENEWEDEESEKEAGMIWDEGTLRSVGWHGSALLTMNFKTSTALPAIMS